MSIDFFTLSKARQLVEKKVIEVGGMTPSSVEAIVKENVGPQVNAYLAESTIVARLNVKDFGAVGDGVTDDTESIQKALNDTNKYKTIYFPEGTYIVTNLVVSSNTILQGAGQGNTILKHSDTFTTDTFAKYSRTSPILSTYTADASIVENVKVYDITIDGNVDNLTITDTEIIPTLTPCNVWLYRVNDCEIKNCSVVNSIGSGIMLHGCNNITIKDNVVKNCGIDTLDSVSMSRNGISILGSYYDDSLSTNVEFLSTNIVVKDNTISEANQEGVMFSYTENLMISDNNIYDCGDRGIEGDSFFSGAEKCLLTINNNIIRNCELYGITIGSTPSNASVIITGNIIDNIKLSKAISLTLGETTFVNISNNVMTNIGNSTTEPSVYVLADHLIFNGNTLSVNTSASAITSACTTAEIANNTFIGVTDTNGITINKSGYTAIKDNIFKHINRVVMLPIDTAYVSFCNNIIMDCIFAIGVSCVVDKLDCHNNYMTVAETNRTQNVIYFSGTDYSITKLSFRENYSKENLYADINNMALVTDYIMDDGGKNPYYNRKNMQWSIPTATTGILKGTVVYSSNLSELGDDGSKYIVYGWLYDGTAWNEMRVLTGN